MAIHIDENSEASMDCQVRHQLLMIQSLHGSSEHLKRLQDSESHFLKVQRNVRQGAVKSCHLVRNAGMQCLDQNTLSENGL